MRILVIGDPHGYNRYKDSVLKKADLILVTGDIGKAEIARKRSFEDYKREKKGLPKKEYIPKQEKQARMEIYNSSMKIVKLLSKYVSTYAILGNIWPKDESTRKTNKKRKVKMPLLVRDMKKIKNFNIAKNQLRLIKGLRVGFLEYFKDTSWVIDFKPGNYKKCLKNAKKETNKAKRILKRFKKVDILVCHQPPYGILDEVSSKYNPPKNWVGKHAGSKVILDYIKRNQPKYVFCGHVHEAKGKKRIGKTEVINAGCCGEYVVIDID